MASSVVTEPLTVLVNAPLQVFRILPVALGAKLAILPPVGEEGLWVDKLEKEAGVLVHKRSLQNPTSIATLLHSCQ